MITYRAAVEELFPGEAENFKCETMAIKRGEYVSSTLPDFMKNAPDLTQMAIVLNGILMKHMLNVW